MEVRKQVKKEVIRELLQTHKSFVDLMQDIMKIGAKIVEQFGHKDYNSPEDFFKDIKEGTSPLAEIDGDVDTDVENIGTNLICVKECPLKNLMKEMSEAGGFDARVNTVMEGHQLREGEESSYVDIGCYIVQQLRQMVISSITVQGKYDLNYIHLGCDKGTGKRSLSKGDLDAINMDEDVLDRLLDKYDCVYAISFKEGQE